MITAQDIHSLAVFMVQRHGTNALNLADRAVEELLAQRAQDSVDAWLALRSVMDHMLSGRLSQAETPRVH